MTNEEWCEEVTKGLVERLGPWGLLFAPQPKKKVYYYQVKGTEDKGKCIETSDTLTASYIKLKLEDGSIRWYVINELNFLREEFE